MLSIDVLFIWLLKFVLLSFLTLTLGSLALRWLKQPVERKNLIQITFAAVLAFLVFALFPLVPKMELGWLPAGLPAKTKSIATASKLKTSSDIDQHAPSGVPETAERGFVPAEVETRGHVVAAIPDKVQNVETRFPVLSWKWAKAVFVVSFLTVSLFQAAYLLFGYLATRRLIANSSPFLESEEARFKKRLSEIAGLDVSRINIVSSKQTKVPLVFGVLRPTIVLPVTVGDADESTLSHCLAHEWKHIEQRDLLTWSAANLLQAFLWIQPGYWSLRSELRICQDQIADRFAASISGEQTEYASTLLRLTKSHHSLLWGALSMAGNKSNLRRRIEMLLNDKFQLMTVSRTRVLVTALVVMSLLSLSFASFKIVQAKSPLDSPAVPILSEQDQDKEEDKAEAEKDEKATEPVEHSGVVLDASNDKPIANARITVHRKVSNTNPWKAVESSTHTTNSEGVFTFSIPPEQQNNRYLYIELDVEHDDYATKKGFGYSYSMIKKNIKLGEPPFFSETKLTPGAAVTGRVVTPDGKGLAGVRLLGYSSPAAKEFSFQRGSFVEGKTEADGSFKINFVKEGDSVFWVLPEEFAMKQIMTGNKRGDLGEIKLEQGYRLTGQVTDAKGSPVAGAYVVVEDIDAQQEIQMPVASSLTRWAKLDENGVYTTRPMRPGNYSLEIKNRGRVSADDEWEVVELNSVFAKMRIELKADSKQQSVNVQAVPHVFVRGRFFDSKDEPTTGHMPHLWGKVDDQFVSYRAEKGEKKGEFYAMVPHGLQDAKIDFMTNEHGALKIKHGEDGKLSEARKVDMGVLDEDFTDLVVYRYVAPILQVNVVDEQGNDVKDAKVGVVYLDSDAEIHHYTVGIKATGLFEKQPDGWHRSSSLCPDSKFEYFAVCDGYEKSGAQDIMKEKETKQVTLVMKKSETKEADSDEKETMDREKMDKEKSDKDK